MAGITYDTDALVTAERGQRPIGALHRRALERGLRPTVPAGVLGQAWRGGPRAELSRLRKGCRIEPLDETGARTAGHACARAKTTDVIDATDFIGAAVREDLIGAGDRNGIRRLATALGASLEIVVV